MKYKTGDKVRIKSGLKVGMEYDYWPILPMMEKYLGKELIIQTVLTEFYQVEGNCFSWTDEMIEGLVEEDKYSEYPPFDKDDDIKTIENIIRQYPKTDSCELQTLGELRDWQIVELNKLINNKYHEDLTKASIAAMQGILANSYFYSMSNADVCKKSIELAKEMLTQLKLEQK